MTINSAANKTIALGNGSQTQFAFGFIGVAAAYISVIFTDSSGNETVLSQGAGATQYQIALNSAVQGALWGIGGMVTYNPSGSPIPNGSSLTIVRTLPLTQAVSLQNQISLAELGNGAETGLDTLEMQIQQISENINRAITAPIVDPPTINLVLPPAAQRANTGIAFDGSGNVIAGTTPATGLISTAMQPVVDASTLAVGRTAFGLGAMATEGIGAGLIDDGAGKARVNNPVTQVASNQTVLASFDLERFIATGPINFTFQAATQYWNGFGFWVEAVTGDVTLIPNFTDNFQGYASGVPFTVPAGTTVFVTTDAASTGTWYVDGMPWLTQNPRSCSGTYNITATDHTKILKHNSGAFGTFIFPAGSTLPANFRCLIINGETAAIGKGVGGTDQGSFRLYPGQSYLVINDHGTVRLVGGIQLYKVNGVALFNNQSLGSDDPLVADGLAAGARGLKTQNGSKQQLYQDFDHNGSQPTVTLTGTYPAESVTFAGQPINTGVFFWNGSAPGDYTVTQSGGVCWIIGDGAIMESANVHLEGTGAGPSTGIQMHQTAILDILSGWTFGNMNGGNHVSSDGAGFSLNVDAGYAIENGGNAVVHMVGAGTGIFTFTGGITIVINGGTPAVITDWFTLSGPVLFNMGAGIAFSGGPAAGTKQWIVQPQAWLSRSGNTIPGTVAGSPAPGSAPAAGSGWVT